MNKRLFLLVVIFVILGGGAFMVFKPNPTKQLERALTHLREGKYSEAEMLLTTYPTPIYTSLYKGYVEQSRNRFDVSHRYLKNAAKESKRAGSRELSGEIALSQAINSYFEEKDSDVFSHIEIAQTQAPDNTEIQFFLGLKHYLQQDYAEATKIWNAYTPQEPQTWLRTSLDTLFSTSWRKLHTAHCLIEQGDLLLAREMIEKESRLVNTDPETLQLATLFLGLSYLKEGQKVALEQRGSYYKLARFYFERAGGLAKYSREKERTISHIEKEALQLFLGSLGEEERQWGFDLVHLLQNWHADSAVEHLAGHLASKLLFAKGEGANTLCEAIRSEFHGTPFHLLLTEKLLTAMSQAVKSGETDNLFDLWALVEQIAPSSQMAAKKIASLTSEEILETIKKDNFSLTRTQNYLSFWEKLGRTPLERSVLAQNLVIYSKFFWHAEHQEKKGQQLMELALSISKHNSIIEGEISSFLTTLYKQAERSNMIGRLSLVYDALEKFDIATHELVSLSTLANHLADADYLYEAHNYSAAKTNAAWVLRLDPHNEEALRLAGLASFHMGEYAHAIAHLKQLSTTDEVINSALTISQAFASQEQTHNICQIDPSTNFEDDEE